MRKVVLGVLISLCIGTLETIGQTDTEWLQKFKKTNNDSVFIATHSDEPYWVFQMKRWMLSLDENNKRLFEASVGTIINFSSAAETHLSKVIKREEKVDTTMQVSHILFKHDSTSATNKKDLEKEVEEVYQKILKGASFADMAKKYGQDGTANTGGSLGKFKTNVMVKPFEEAILKHKKGDMFKVWTKYGLHIVKVDADLQFKSKALVTYVRFVKGKKYVVGKTAGYQIRLPAGWEQKTTKADINVYRADIPATVNIHVNQPTVNLTPTELENGYQSLKASYPDAEISHYDQREISSHKGFYFESAHAMNDGNKLKVYSFIFNSKKYAYVFTLTGLQQSQDYLQRMLYMMIKEMKIKN